MPTGALTLAMSVIAGETWSAAVSGIPLSEVALRVDAGEARLERTGNTCTLM